MKNIRGDGIGSLRECARRTGEVGGAFPSGFSARDGCMRRSLTPRGFPVTLQVYRAIVTV